MSHVPWSDDANVRTARLKTFIVFEDTHRTDAAVATPSSPPEEVFKYVVDCLHADHRLFAAHRVCDVATMRTLVRDAKAEVFNDCVSSPYARAWASLRTHSPNVHTTRILYALSMLGDLQDVELRVFWNMCMTAGD